MTSHLWRRPVALVLHALITVLIIQVVFRLWLLPAEAGQPSGALLLRELLVALAIVLAVVILASGGFVLPLRRTIRATRAAITDPDASRPDPALLARIAWTGVPRLIEEIQRRMDGDKAAYRQLEKVRSEFLGNVSHELRTPIFTLQGYLETLINGAVDDPTVNRNFLKRAFAQTTRLNSLLQDLIEISRMESGDMRLSLRHFDAREFITGIHRENVDITRDRGITLELAVLSQSSITILGDRQRLRQALENLIENAVKYNHPEGAIRLVLDATAYHVIISVIDTGIGIPAEHLPRLFERFYRVDKNRSREIGGTGLGLAIVKHIILAHKGSITVDSTPGVGSTFTIQLPRGMI